MNKEFIPDDNPIAEMVLSAMMRNDGKFFEEKNIIQLYQEIFEYLTFVLDNEGDAEMLDFDMKTDINADKVEIKPKNLVTGLWFSGIFPDNCRKVEESGKFTYEGAQYTLNQKTKALNVKRPI